MLVNCQETTQHKYIIYYNQLISVHKLGDRIKNGLIQIP
jgi:hypothetical protein